MHLLGFYSVSFVFGVCHFECEAVPSYVS
jgi:hypothetical protein